MLPPDTKIAVVGAGISGLGAAWALSKHYRVTLFEAADYLGGHAHTVLAPGVGPNFEDIPVDTGFLVYNERNYPHLTALFKHLDVQTQPSKMTFGVSLGHGDFEYGTDAKYTGILAQPGNLTSKRWWSLIRGLKSFYSAANHFLKTEPNSTVPLSAFLDRYQLSGPIVDDHILPMAGAIWSGTALEMRDYPARTLLDFFRNHGLLSIRGKPKWRTVTNGSAHYVRRLIDDYTGEVRLNSAVTALNRTTKGVTLHLENGSSDHADVVVIACHSDQALTLLGAEATQQERDVLSAIRFSKNEAILHSDKGQMPRARLAWSAWNYIKRNDDEQPVTVTYWLNRLQSLTTREPLFVTLNPHEPLDESLVIDRFTYHHPVFDTAALNAQALMPTVQGTNSLWFAGAYCGFGFHEDGLQAGLNIAAALGAPAPWWSETEPRSSAVQSVAFDQARPPNEQ